MIFSSFNNDSFFYNKKKFRLNFIIENCLNLKIWSELFSKFLNL